MTHNHLQQRLLCSQIVSVCALGTDRPRVVEALLEEIGPSGAAISLDCPLRKGHEIKISCGGCDIHATAVRCQKWIQGYFVDVEFPEDEDWTPERFTPKRLFNPSSMICNRRYCRSDCTRTECLGVRTPKCSAWQSAEKHQAV
jgi:hypothetical protein